MHGVLDSVPHDDFRERVLVVHEYTKGEQGESPNEEVEQLRRECARLVQEREILKKLWRCMPGRRSCGESVRNI